MPRVVNYDTMLAAVRHYVGGFRDGHLVYSDDLRGQSMPMRRTGWSPGFDARGNGGGNSGVGWRIFEAVTGGLEYDENDLDRLPQTHARWRVSALAIARMTDAVARSREVYRESSEEYPHGLARVQAMRTALTEGRDWVRQDDGPRLDRAEMEARKARLKHFDGRIALLVDHRCVSACLDFSDLIAQVQGSLRLGKTTGGDAVYIDGGARVELPGGNRLFLPLKVWRNRCADIRAVHARSADRSRCHRRG